MATDPMVQRAIALDIRAEALRRGEFQLVRPAAADVVPVVLAGLDDPEGWIETGIAPLDRLLDGGLRGGEVCVIAARPGVGKSALALQIILRVVEEWPVYLWSLEMPPETWLLRAVCSVSGVPMDRARRGELTALEGERVRHVTKEIGRYPLFFSGGPTDPMGWVAEARSAVECDDCRLLCVDYLQLLDPPREAYSRENEVATISRTIKMVANELNVPILLLAQLNRNAEGKSPSLADLRESGAVEQDADIVTFIHREKDAKAHVMENTGRITVAKNRNGRLGTFGIEYDGAHFRFRCFDGAHQYDPQAGAGGYRQTPNL